MGYQLAMTVPGAVKALDELGLVDATHKADAVSKVGEVRQVVIAAGGVHIHWGAHHRHKAQVPGSTPQAAWKRHGCALHSPHCQLRAGQSALHGRTLLSFRLPMQPRKKHCLSG